MQVNILSNTLLIPVVVTEFVFPRNAPFKTTLSVTVVVKSAIILFYMFIVILNFFHPISIVHLPILNFITCLLDY